MPCVPIIYCFPGIPTLPRKIGTFWTLVHVVLAEIHESVSLYFDQDCLRKNKNIISGILSGRIYILFAFFLKKGYIFHFLAPIHQLKVHYLLLNQVSRLQETRYLQKHFISHNYVTFSYFLLAKCYKMLFSN